ncbi:MAG: hypothetical protein K2K14_05085, partial [Ruminococcus sp.]|nr:hypothetical protein [Ruminococcus sp.]
LSNDLLLIYLYYIIKTDLQKKKNKKRVRKAHARKLLFFSKPKRKFGSYQNVPLTDEEYQNLCDYYGTKETDRSIESMSEYMASHDTKYNIPVRLEQWIEEDIEKYGFVEPDKIPTQEEVKKIFESVNEIMIARGWKTESTDTFPVPFPEPSGQFMAVRA